MSATKTEVVALFHDCTRSLSSGSASGLSCCTNLVTRGIADTHVMPRGGLGCYCNLALQEVHPQHGLDFVSCRISPRQDWPFTCQRGFSTEQQSQSSEQTAGSGIGFRETQVAQQPRPPIIVGNHLRVTQIKLGHPAAMINNRRANAQPPGSPRGDYIRSNGLKTPVAPPG